MHRANAILLSVHSWSELTSKLAAFGTDAAFKKLKGEVFERLTECLLKVDPIYRSQFKNIWHHANIPIQVRDYLNLPSPEIGVDLVAQCRDGTYCAIQCKFHQDPSVNVSYKELSTFFSVTERHNTFSKLSLRLVVTSAESVSKHVLQNHTEKLSIISLAKFRTLDSEWFTKIHQVTEGNKIAYFPFTPRHHQKEAISAAFNHFVYREHDRGKIIHPCGSGKSLTAYWIAQKLSAKSILIAVPSLALVKQTLGAWAREATANGVFFEWMAICSDKDVDKSDGQVFQTQELGIAVTTDVSKVRDFILNNSGIFKVVITTYQSGNVVAAACKPHDFSFDLGIFDEAHKTTGHRHKKFSLLLDNDNLAISKRIFMTATERQFKGDSTKFLSMDDLSVYGGIIHQLSFKAALEQQPPILSDYKIVTCVVEKNEIREFVSANTNINVQDFDFESQASTFAAFIALSKLVAERKIQHAITFHSTIRRAKYFSTISNEISLKAQGLDRIQSFHVSGKLSSGERSSELARFVANKPSAISNARCLTEGVDIPAVDAVVFADPKNSVIDIVQAAGRAMRTHPDKDFGYIIIPVIVDEASDEPAHDVFRQLIAVIAALGINDDRIIDEAKQWVKREGKSKNPIIEIMAASPEPAPGIKFAELVKGVEIKIWDRLSFAKSVIGESEFAQWMRISTDLSEKSIKNYKQAVRKISNDLVKMCLTFSTLLEITEKADLRKLKELYFSIDEFRELDKRGKSMYSAGFNKLIAYQEAKKADK